MESIIKADVFFFISSIAIVLMTVMFVIAMFYLIKIMKDFAHISEALRGTVDGATHSLEEIGDHIKGSPIFRFFFGKKRNKK